MKTTHDKKNFKKKEWVNAKKSLSDLQELPEIQLQKAFLYLCELEFKTNEELNELYGRINHFEKLKRRISKIAEGRQINLVYPDQAAVLLDDKKRQYFEAERKVKGTISSPSPKAVISADSTQV